MKKISKDLKAEFNIASDGDDWGNCMSWWFNVSNEIEFNRDAIEVPASWGFRASPLGNSNDEDSYDVRVIQDLADDDLLHFGNMLSRYNAFLRLAGKNY